MRRLEQREASLSGCWLRLVQSSVETDRRCRSSGVLIEVDVVECCRRCASPNRNGAEIEVECEDDEGVDKGAEENAAVARGSLASRSRLGAACVLKNRRCFAAVVRAREDGGGAAAAPAFPGRKLSPRSHVSLSSVRAIEACASRIPVERLRVSPSSSGSWWVLPTEVGIAVPGVGHDASRRA